MVKISDVPTTQAIDEIPFNRFHLRVTVMTFGANFTDGYILGMIGALLPALTAGWSLTGLESGLLASSALIGLFFGSLVLGRVGDLIGRQRVFVLNFVIITVASILQFWADGFLSLFILRLVIGFGLGADYAVGPTLLSEFSPRKSRGMMLSSLTVMWTVGYVAANVLGSLFLTGEESWRALLASGAIPALLVLVVRIGAPESPGWLISKGRIEEAQKIVGKYLKAEISATDLAANASPEESHGFRELFASGQAKYTWFGIVFYSALVLPYFAIYTFMPTIFDNLEVSDGHVQEVVLNVFLLLGGIAGLWFVQKFSRRGATIISFLVLTVSLVLLGLLAHGSVVVLMIPFVVYTFVMSAASNLTQVYPAELFPTRLRATGVGLLNALSRIASAAGTFILPIMLTAWGISWSMFALALVLLIGLLFTIKYAPETSTKHLV
ncbi:MFS transporter [Rothia uropygialis]|uniref:MFS transporter n=1 Tax=Kocuria sp. 36 TaxID=1415402 RepID=UPI00101C3D0D|nr:MFS transporter [Kocuria sp. 36]